MSTSALVTPSFRTDFERCSLLVRSAERWVTPDVKHYLVIDQRDVPLFKPLESSRTQVLVVEDIVPWWIRRIPRVRKFWMSFRSLPIRNWILQQIVKLSIAKHVTTDNLFFVDSDTFFCAPFDPVALSQNGLPPFFMETGQRGLIPNNDKWHASAARLLGIPVEPSYDTNFIGNVIPWKRENVLALHRRLEDVAGKAWELAIAPQTAFSEYILYGLFATRVLKEKGQWHDKVEHTLCYWKTQPLDQAGLEALKEKRQPQHYSVMVSAKSKTPVSLIQQVFTPDA